MTDAIIIAAGIITAALILADGGGPPTRGGYRPRTPRGPLPHPPTDGSAVSKPARPTR